MIAMLLSTLKRLHGLGISVPQIFKFHLKPTAVISGTKLSLLICKRALISDDCRFQRCSFCNYTLHKIALVLPGQLFCNCPLFVMALVLGLFFGGKPAETCCRSVAALKKLKTQSVCSVGRKYYNLNTNTDYKELGSLTSEKY